MAIVFSVVRTTSLTRLNFADTFTFGNDCITVNTDICGVFASKAAAMQAFWSNVKTEVMMFSPPPAITPAMWESMESSNFGDEEGGEFPTTWKLDYDGNSTLSFFRNLPDGISDGTFGRMPHLVQVHLAVVESPVL